MCGFYFGADRDENGIARDNPRPLHQNDQRELGRMSTRFCRRFEASPIHPLARENLLGDSIFESP